MDEAQVGAVRRFNRFYTRQTGLLHEKLLSSAFSLTEVRVLYELAERESATASTLASELGLDAGYLSRLLQGFDKQGLIRKRRLESDGRSSILSLTPKGRRTFAPLNQRSDQQVAGLLEKMPEGDRTRLVEAMGVVEELLGAKSVKREPFVLRPHRPGDMGWVIQRHAEIYALEYGWNEEFEALVAEIAAKFIREFDAKRERCWLAEQDGERIGSVFMVKNSEDVAQLRLLIVDPKARGLGLGRKLVDECVMFARYAGYRKLRLWTNDVLAAARHIYQAAGFRLVEESPHHSWGKPQVGQTWELDL